MASSKSELYRVKPREPSSLKGSSAAEIKGTAALERLLNEASPVCSDADITTRELVIQALQEALEDWVTAVAVEKGLYPDKKSAKACGGTIYISGSFRLGVSGPSADIDAICVTPRFVTRDDFFQGFTARLQRVPGITKVRPIASAAVPLTEVELDGIEVDLLFCRLNRASIHPSKLDILDDLVLKGADIASVRSINGPRVTELLATLVPDKARYRLVLRATRLWCKRRGLYSNKMGFLGGVNLGIIAAYFCQRFPAMEPAGILFRFFVYLARWNWPDPVFITTPYQRVDMSLEVPVWDPARNPQHARHRMPIITPAYPCDNSTYNVLSSTLAVMRREFRRGMRVMTTVLHDPETASDSSAWQPLFDADDFLFEHDGYIVVHGWCTDVDAHGHFVGYVESRLRRLVELLEGSCAHLNTLYPYPRSIEWERPEPVLRATHAAIVALDDSASHEASLAAAKLIAREARASFEAAHQALADEDGTDAEKPASPSHTGQAHGTEGEGAVDNDGGAAAAHNHDDDDDDDDDDDTSKAQAVSSLARTAAAAAAAEAVAVTGWQPAQPVLSDLGEPVPGLLDVEDDPLVIMDGNLNSPPVRVQAEQGTGAAGAEPTAAAERATRPSLGGGWGEDEEVEEAEPSAQEGVAATVPVVAEEPSADQYADADAIVPGVADGAGSWSGGGGGGDEAEPAAAKARDASEKPLEAVKAADTDAAPGKAAPSIPTATVGASLTASDELRFAVARGMQPVKSFFVGLRFDRSRVATEAEDGSAAARPTGPIALASLRVPQTVLDEWARSLLERYEGAPSHKLALAASVVQWEALPERVFSEVAGVEREASGAAKPADGVATKAEAKPDLEAVKPEPGRSGSEDEVAATASASDGVAQLRKRLRERRSRAARQFAVEDGVRLRARASLTWTAQSSAAAQGGSAAASSTGQADDPSMAAVRAVADDGTLPGLDDGSHTGRAGGMSIASGGVIETRSAETGVTVTATALSLQVSDAGPSSSRAAATKWVDDGSGLPGLGADGDEDEDQDEDGGAGRGLPAGSAATPAAGSADPSPTKRPREEGPEATAAAGAHTGENATPTAGPAAQAPARVAASSGLGFAALPGARLRPAYVSVVDRLAAASASAEPAPAVGPGGSGGAPSTAPEAKRVKVKAAPSRKRRGGGRGKRNVAI